MEKTAEAAKVLLKMADLSALRQMTDFFVVYLRQMPRRTLSEKGCLSGDRRSYEARAKSVADTVRMLNAHLRQDLTDCATLEEAVPQVDWPVDEQMEWKKAPGQVRSTDCQAAVRSRDLTCSCRCGLYR